MDNKLCFHFLSCFIFSSWTLEPKIGPFQQSVTAARVWLRMKQSQYPLLSQVVGSFSVSPGCSHLSSKEPVSKEQSCVGHWSHVVLGTIEKTNSKAQRSSLLQPPSAIETQALISGSSRSLCHDFKQVFLSWSLETAYLWMLFPRFTKRTAHAFLTPPWGAAGCN